MSSFRLGVTVGIIAALVMAIVSIISIGFYLGINPDNVYFFDRGGLKGAYIIHAPERDTHERVQNLLEGNIIVLNLALELPNEKARVLALRYWSIVMLCGMDPEDDKCDGNYMTPSPKGQRL